MRAEKHVLDERIEQSLRNVHAELSGKGELFSPDQLQQYHDIFRSRFGPERLRQLDSDALLQTMHSHGNKDSLVYWLEFKNDEEFPGIAFGSIAGGSAHKFGLFRRQERGQWVAGSPQNEISLTPAEAFEVARKHRDQLLAGVAVLDKFPENASNEEYLRLQQDLENAAPDLSHLAWAHKYFSLLFPTKLDDFHNHKYQRYHLVKLLQRPPEQRGLYAAAGLFVRLAAHFAWPINHFTTVLNKRNGSPVTYWRININLDLKENAWTAMRAGRFVGIGWPKIGDLASLAETRDLKEVIRQKLESTYPGEVKSTSQTAGEIRNFVANFEDGDIVIAADGERVLGIGRVTGDYRFDESDPKDFPHRRPVEWISTEEWDLTGGESKGKIVSSVGKNEANLLEIEQRIVNQRTPPTPPDGKVPSNVSVNIQLTGLPGRIQGILDRKGQVILYGPPGTGKTFWARSTARDLAAISRFGRRFNELSKEESAQLEGSNGLVRFCTFHPAYGYEDFIEGYRPTGGDKDQLSFVRRDGIFKSLCRDAWESRDRKFFLLIDEINRGDIPRIFGELLTLLEKDKRGMEVVLPVSGERFSVPPNVFVIGTMNTADRSIALIDTALRRRFGFIELMPDASVLSGISAGGHIPLAAWLTTLNDRIRAHSGRDARNLQVGHAYLLEDGRPISSLTKFARILAEDIIPLLEEYCYEDFAALSNILGDGLVDMDRQRIRHELFEPANHEKLIQAVSAISPEMSTSIEAKPEPTSEALEPDDDEQ